MVIGVGTEQSDGGESPPRLLQAALGQLRLEGAASGWVQASIAYSLEESAPPSNLSRSLISTRLPELVLIEVLRVHLAMAPAVDRGWIAALNDPVLAPALALLHTSPARRWTVGDLAAGAFVSRSLLDERFRQVLGRSPLS